MLGAVITDILGIANITDIADIITDIADTTTDIADIAIYFADIADIINI